ncbi:MAG: carboxylating nicotinate-nucleotide diphosphorylase [Acholeplasmataceae bacterium]|nr:carboxylating nicotinate-nucleotide diphosphorylase [Acholeplasmataceae bacterium]
MIQRALDEDMPLGDITASALFCCEESVAKVIAKSEGIVSGLVIFQRVFEIVDSNTAINVLKKDGDFTDKGSTLATIKGNTLSILKAERTALNFLQRMSGISTETNRYVEAIKDTNCKILDTRKTAPTLRALDKLAVLHGGGLNHRFSLSDMAILKDNHIAAAGSITKAVEKVRKTVGPSVKIEVEVESIDALKEALNTSADWIMLDNMDNDTMRQCVMITAGRKKLEASGNMTLERVRSVAETGVDFISVGALTHSVKAFDISLRFDLGDDLNDSK